MRAAELQVAIYNALTSSAPLMALATGVYDHVPEEAEYPYVQIGEDIATQADTDTTLDSDHLLTIHTWARYRGQLETKRLQEEVYGALHRGLLQLPGFTDCQIESEENFLDDDGLTRHGVQRFRVLLDEVTP